MGNRTNQSYECVKRLSSFSGRFARQRRTSSRAEAVKRYIYQILWAIHFWNNDRSERPIHRTLDQIPARCGA